MSSRDSALLGAGSAVSGVLAYVFFALASRTLGADDAAPVSVLWTYWAIAAATLTFPVQHWTIRRFTGDAHEGAVGRSVPVLSVGVVGLALLSGVLAFVLRYELFGVGGLAFPVMLAGVTAASFFTGLVRGVLSGRGRYAATAASLAGENAARVVAAAVAAISGGDARAFGLALLLGSVVSLLWVRSLSFGVAPSGSAKVRNPLALMSGVALGSLTAQVVLTGGPLLLAVTGGAPAEVTSMFLALAVWRAPYIVAMGVTPQLTAGLTHLAVEAPSGRITRLVLTIVLAVLLAAALAAAAGATVLGPLLQLAFGGGVEMTAPVLAGLGIGTVVALGNLVLLLLLLALGRSAAGTAAWMAAVAVSGLWILLSPMDAAPTVVVAFLVAESTAFVALVGGVETILRSRRRRAAGAGPRGDG